MFNSSVLRTALGCHALIPADHGQDGVHPIASACRATRLARLCLGRGFSPAVL